MCRESVRASATLALGLLPWDGEAWAILCSTAQRAEQGSLQGAALEACAQLSAAEGAPNEAVAQTLGLLLSMLLASCPETAAEVWNGTMWL